MPPILDNLFSVYVGWVQTSPIISAMIQFAILGTLGEIISKWIIQKSLRYPFNFFQTLWKMVVWALLGVAIKYAFKGYVGFVEYLAGHDMLPQAVLTDKFWRAFSISGLMNLQFGLFLVLVHRLLDNIGAGKMNWKGLDKSFLSLLWFWIPAHTVTFMQADDLRVGLAALWSVVLGLILGFFNRR